MYHLTFNIWKVQLKVILIWNIHWQIHCNAPFHSASVVKDKLEFLRLVVLNLKISSILASFAISLLSDPENPLVFHTSFAERIKNWMGN